MKRVKYGMAIVAGALGIALSASTAGAEMNNHMNNMKVQQMQDMKMKEMSMKDMKMMDGKKWMPLRMMAEKCGYMVKWNDKDHSITLMSSKTMNDNKKMMKMNKIRFMIGSKKIMMDGTEKMVMDAPMLIDNRTYVTQEFIDMFLPMANMMKK
jgi:hypothetical protein